MNIRHLLQILSILTVFSTNNALAEPLRVSPDWLKINLSTQKMTLLDTRLPENYDIDHLPGALSFPDSLTYQQKSSGGKIVEPDVLQRLLRERGVSANDMIVVYDDGNLLDAARVFWALEVYGLTHVRVLERGYAGWTKLGYKVTTEVPKVAPSQFVPVVDRKKIASKFSTQLATVNTTQVIVDARPDDAFRGIVSSAKRFGHIPAAVNIPVTKNLLALNEGTELRSPAELKSVYASLPVDKKVIVYCSVGRVSATNYLVLRELGYDVANYDASWQEWGNDFNLPVEK